MCATPASSFDAAFLNSSIQVMHSSEFAHVSHFAIASLERE